MTTMTDLEAPEARDVRRLAEDLDIRTKAFIDGEYVDAASGETFARINPATGIEIAPRRGLRHGGRRTRCTRGTHRVPVGRLEGTQRRSSARR